MFYLKHNFTASATKYSFCI